MLTAHNPSCALDPLELGDDGRSNSGRSSNSLILVLSVQSTCMSQPPECNSSNLEVISFSSNLSWAFSTSKTSPSLRLSARSALFSMLRARATVAQRLATSPCCIRTWLASSSDPAGCRQMAARLSSAAHKKSSSASLSWSGTGNEGPLGEGLLFGIGSSH